MMHLLHERTRHVHCVWVLCESVKIKRMKRAAAKKHSQIGVAFHKAARPKVRNFSTTIIRMYYSTHNNIHCRQAGPTLFWWWWQQLGRIIPTCLCAFFCLVVVSFDFFFLSLDFFGKVCCVSSSWQSAYWVHFTLTMKSMRSERNMPLHSVAGKMTIFVRHLVTSIKRSHTFVSAVCSRSVPYQISNYDNLIIISMRCCTNKAKFCADTVKYKTHADRNGQVRFRTCFHTIRW